MDGNIEGAGILFADGQRRVWDLRASGDGRVLSPARPVLQLSANGCVVKHFKGGGTPGPDGKYLFGVSRVITTDGTEVNREKSDGDFSLTFVPASTAPYYLKVPSGMYQSIPGAVRFRPISVHCLGDSRPLTTLQEINGVFHEIGADASPLLLDQQYHLIPDATLLVTLPRSANQLELHRLNVEEMLSRSGVNYFFATSTPFPLRRRGKEYRYRRPGEVEKGGVQYSPRIGSTGDEDLRRRRPHLGNPKGLRRHRG